MTVWSSSNLNLGSKTSIFEDDHFKFLIPAISSEDAPKKKKKRAAILVLNKVVESRYRKGWNAAVDVDTIDRF